MGGGRDRSRRSGAGGVVQNGAMHGPRPPIRRLGRLSRWGTAGLVCALGIAALVGAARASDAGRDALAALGTGLRSEDPAVRRRAVSEVVRARGDLDASQSRRAAVALRKALDVEADRETRRDLVRALARLGTEASWVSVLLAALDERDDAVRLAAALEVVNARRGVLDVVARLLREDKDPTFRARLLLLLGDRRRTDAVPLLIERLDDEAPRVAAAAAEALEAITNQPFGFDGALWARWHERFLTAETARRRESGHATVAEEDLAVDSLPERRPTRGLVPEFFGLRLGAKDIVFVVDVSGSIGPNGLDRVRRELIRSVERLGSDVHVAAIFFAEEARLFRPELVPATPVVKGELAHFLRGVAPGRKTDVFTPLNAGLALVRKRVEAKISKAEAFPSPVTLIVVSDGQNNVDRTSPAVVEDKLGRLDLARTVVHAVVVGGEPHPLMLELARRGGGQVVRVP